MTHVYQQGRSTSAVPPPPPPPSLDAQLKTAGIELLQVLTQLARLAIKELDRPAGPVPPDPWLTRKTL